MKACRNCRRILNKDEIDAMIKEKNRVSCPNCTSTDFSEDFSGMVIIIDAASSEIAKQLEVENPGTYALRVR